MKKLLIAFVAAACAMSSCSDDNTAEEVSRDSIAISVPTIPASPEGGTTEITVTSSGDWRISGVCDWARPSAVSGKNGDTVTFTVDPNETDAARETTFKFFTGSAVAPLKIVSEAGYSLDLISDAEVTLGKAKTTLSVKLHTNIPDLESTFSDNGGKWITYVQRTEAFGNTILNFEVAENTTFDNRSTVLTISGMGRELPVSIMQKQVDEILVEPESFEFDLAEQTLSIDVSANVDYEVTIPVEWVQQLETRALETRKLNFHVDAADVTRGTTITIKGAGITRTVSVIQKDPDAIVAMIPDDALRSYVAEMGWVVDLGSGVCALTQDGLTVTNLTYNPGWRDPKIKSIEGIDAFPELTTIDVSSNELTSVDISGLTKVSSFKCAYMDGITTVNFGANPITDFAIHNGSYDYVVFETLTIAGEKLETLNVAMTSYYSVWDELKAIDVSGCPALQTLDCRRGDSLTTLYLKTGQVIPNLTKNDVTQIVYK